MILICLAFVWMRWVEPSLLSVTSTDVRAAGVPAAADGLRIAQFTDTHFGFDYDVKRFERAVEKINSFEPHIVVFTGDLYEQYAKYPADDDGIICLLYTSNHLISARDVRRLFDLLQNGVAV